MKSLSDGINQLTRGIENLNTLQATLRRPNDAQLMLIVQNQLESSQSQRLVLSKELRDLGIKRALSTQMTATIAPPASSNRIWPRRDVFVIVFMAAALTLAATVVVLFS